MRKACFLLLATLMMTPAIAIEVGTNVVIHPSKTLTWITWNYPFVSNQPIVVSSTYFTIGGIKWSFTPIMKTRIVFNYYNPNNLHEINKTFCEFVAYSNKSGYLTFTVVGIPNGNYTIVVNNKTYVVEAKLNKIEFKYYFNKIATFTIKRESYENPISAIRKKISGFESVFAVVGFITTAYLLDRGRDE